MMKTRYTIITLLGALGASFLLLLLLASHPMHAQAPEPSSAPIEGEATEPSGEVQAGDIPLAVDMQSSAPVLPDGSRAAPASGPILAEGPPDVGAAAITDFRVPGTALKPRGDDVSYVPTAGGGCFYASSGNAFRVFNTGLYLPRGSNVLAMRMYYDDTSSSDSRAWFSVYDLYGNLVDEWGVASAGNSGNGFNDTDTISHTIDYGVYSYAINWRPSDLGSDTQVCGFRIFYEPPPFGATYLPMVIRE
jgi:hypothetical protein